jgi:hypothetical protein
MLDHDINCPILDEFTGGTVPAQPLSGALSVEERQFCVAIRLDG